MNGRTLSAATLAELYSELGRRRAAMKEKKCECGDCKTCKQRIRMQKYRGKIREGAAKYGSKAKR